jgi:Rieske Fe-S protein
MANCPAHAGPAAKGAGRGCLPFVARSPRPRADGNSPFVIDPARDEDRVKCKEWLIVVGVCTHLGCGPLRL